MNKNKIPTYILAAGSITLLITQPLLTILIATIGSINFSIYNKLTFKNKKSSLFGINKNNFIGQKFTNNIIKNNFIKSKSDKFNVELSNLLLDLEANNTYKTRSQSIVLKSLKKLEKEGYINNLEATKVNMSKSKSKLVHLFVNISMGNFDNLLKVTKKFDISFEKNEKEIDKFIIDEFLKDHYELIYNKDNSIKLVKYRNKITQEIKNNNLEVEQATKIDQIKDDNKLENTLITNFDFNKYKSNSDNISNQYNINLNKSK